MTKQQQILKLRLDKLEIQQKSIKEYKEAIDQVISIKNIYDSNEFFHLEVTEKALLDAYLKRFSSIQDFLGAKIFPLLLDVAGIGTSKMSDVLNYIAKEEIIDSLENWIEIREIRNELEHDYPDNITEALADLEICINSFDKLYSYCQNSITFAKGYIK